MSTDGFGLWQLFLRVVVFLGLFDIGVAPALAKYVSEYDALGDRDRLDRIVNSAFLFYVVLGIASLVAGLVFTDSYLHFIRTPTALMEPARVSFRWVVVVTAMVVASSAPRSLLIGLQRLDVINLIEVVVNTLMLGAIIWIALASRSPAQALVRMGVVQFAQFLLISAAIYHYAVRLTPGYRFRPTRVDRPSYRLLLSYGWRASAMSIANLAQGQTEWFLLARFLGPGPVALYSFGAKITDVWKSVVNPAFQAVIAAASAMSATGGTEIVRRLYDRGARILNAAVLGVSVWLVAVAPIIITAWMGAGYGKSVMALRFLAVAAAAVLASGMAGAIGRGLNVMRPGVIASVVLATVELGAGFALGPAFGYKGLLAATLSAFVLFALTLIVLTHRAFRWPVLTPLLQLYFLPAALAAIAATPVLWYNHVHRGDIVRFGADPSRILRLGWIGAWESVLIVALYALILWMSRFITPEDVRSLRDAIKGARTAHRDPVAGVEAVEGA
jgi:stage V sporulation protein B